MSDPQQPEEQKQPPPASGEQPTYGTPPEQQQSNPPPGGQSGPPPGQQQYGPPPGQQQYGPPPGQQQYGPPPGQQYGNYPAAPAYSQPPQTDQFGRVFDPASGLYLPPGVELASNGRRIGAYFLAIPLVIVTLVIGYVIWGLIVWSRGTTPALQVLGMKCYHIDSGTVPDFGRMALREVVGRFLVESIIGIIGVISFILMLTNARRQTLHDMIAGTTVLYDPNKVLH